jgi:UDP-glucose 4-epimerase
MGNRVRKQRGGLFRGRRVLVVGSAGFLGRYAIDTLAELGANITALVRQARDFSMDSCSGINRVVVGDLKDSDVASEVVQGQEVVLDFAGVTSTVNSNRDSCLSLLEECSPHLKLLAAAEMVPPPPIVFRVRGWFTVSPYICRWTRLIRRHRRISTACTS